MTSNLEAQINFFAKGLQDTHVDMEGLLADDEVSKLGLELSTSLGYVDVIHFVDWAMQKYEASEFIFKDRSGDVVATLDLSAFYEAATSRGFDVPLNDIVKDKPDLWNLCDLVHNKRADLDEGSLIAFSLMENLRLAFFAYLSGTEVVEYAIADYLVEQHGFTEGEFEVYDSSLVSGSVPASFSNGRTSTYRVPGIRIRSHDDSDFVGIEMVGPPDGQPTGKVVFPDPEYSSDDFYDLAEHVENPEETLAALQIVSKYVTRIPLRADGLFD